MHTGVPCVHIPPPASPPCLDDTDDVSSCVNGSYDTRSGMGQTYKHASPPGLSTRLTCGTASHEGSPASQFSISSMRTSAVEEVRPTRRMCVYACTCV